MSREGTPIITEEEGNDAFSELDALEQIDEVEMAASEFSESEAREVIAQADDILKDFDIDAEYYFGSGPETEELLDLAVAIDMVRKGDPEALGIVNALVDGATERIAISTRDDAVTQA